MTTTPPGTESGGATTSGYGRPPRPPRPPGRPPWRMVRREEGKLLAGVTTGMADAFGIDVMVVRVIWAIVTVASFGLGIAAYFICWIAFPSDLHPAPISEIHGLRNRGGGYIVGVTLLVIGALFVIGQLAAVRPMHHIGALGWATVLIAGGAAILFLRNRDDDDRDPDTDIPDAAPVPDATPAPDWSNPTEAPSEPQPAAAESDAFSDSPHVDDAIPPPPTVPSPPLPPIPPTSSAWTQSEPWPTAPQRRVRKQRPRPFITPVTISLLLIGAGACALLDSTGSVHFTVAGILASGLILVGLAMVVSAWFGRAHGLIPIGVILLLVTIPAVAIDVPISGGIGEQRYAPTTRAELNSHYELGIGHLNLDLVRAPLKNRVTSISAQLGIGELSVNVPTNVRVEVDAHTGAGHTELFGRNSGGAPHDEHAIAGVNQHGILHLDLEVGAGAVIVRRETANGSIVIYP